jgi:hypothetical protein
VLCRPCWWVFGSCEQVCIRQIGLVLLRFQLNIIRSSASLKEICSRRSGPTDAFQFLQKALLLQSDYQVQLFAMRLAFSAAIAAKTESFSQEASMMSLDLTRPSRWKCCFQCAQQLSSFERRSWMLIWGRHSSDRSGSPPKVMPLR